MKLQTRVLALGKMGLKDTLNWLVLLHAGQTETNVKALTCVQAWLGLGLKDSSEHSISSPAGLYQSQVTAVYTTFQG